MYRKGPARRLLTLCFSRRKVRVKRTRRSGATRSTLPLFLALSLSPIHTHTLTRSREQYLFVSLALPRIPIFQPQRKTTLTGTNDANKTTVRLRVTFTYTYIFKNKNIQNTHTRTKFLIGSLLFIANALLLSLSLTYFSGAPRHARALHNDCAMRSTLLTWRTPWDCARRARKRSHTVRARTRERKKKLFMQRGRHLPPKPN